MCDSPFQVVASALVVAIMAISILKYKYIAKCYVLRGLHDSLLGLKTALKLGVIKIINNVHGGVPRIAEFIT